MDINEIKKIIPHREPFILVDRIIAIDLEKETIIGEKDVLPTEDYFRGHFPDAPIMPGVLILEALAQTGGVLVGKKTGSEKYAVLLRVTDARFRSPVKPGDVLRLECQGVHISNKGGKIKAVAKVGDRVAVEGEMAFALVNKEQI